MTQLRTHLPIVLGLVGLMGVLVSLSVLRFLSPPQLEDLQRLGAVEYGSARDFNWPHFVDERGQTFERKQFSDYWTLVFFGFTHCPDICPVTMSVFTKMAENLERDAIAKNTRYLMISVDPERDTVARMRQWLSGFHPVLKGLRGDLAATYTLARDFSVSFQKEAPYTGSVYNIQHSGNVFLVGPDGKQHGFVRTVASAQGLEHAYRAMRKRFEHKG